ncbi:MAG: tRNA lysidine(34) synthetase TilS [Clostridiales bacterium]|nr:tRNA lysidine(34) synthetase TilS [Clostridiales bacterium]
MESASLLGQGATLLAGVSGGVDSAALLHALVLLRQEAGFRLWAAHLDHGLRGAASGEDAAFVQALCRELDVPLLLRHAHLPGDMDSPGMEDLARRTRRAFFLSAMEEVQADAVLLAHHQDDQAETVLMRLLRGAGAQGLGGMRPVIPFGRGLLVRPFLGLSRDSLRSAMLKAGKPWREDESNALPCCLRNRLRLEVMPMLSAYQSQAALHMAQAAQRLGWDEDCLATLAQALLHEALVPMPGCHALDLAPLHGKPTALLTRVLRMWAGDGTCLAGQNASTEDPSLPEDLWATGERSLSHEDTLRVLALIQSPLQESINLPWGLKALRTAGYLHLLRQDGSPLLPLPRAEPVPLSWEQGIYSLASHIFHLSPLAAGPPFSHSPRQVLLREEQLAQSLMLRYPQSGDEIRPFGAPGRKPLRRFLTDRKVPLPFRPMWPVLVQGSRVLWVPWVACGEETRLPPQPGKLWLLTLQTPLPHPPIPTSTKGVSPHES